MVASPCCRRWPAFPIATIWLKGSSLWWHLLVQALVHMVLVYTWSWVRDTTEHLWRDGSHYIRMYATTVRPWFFYPHMLRFCFYYSRGEKTKKLVYVLVNTYQVKYKKKCWENIKRTFCAVKNLTRTQKVIWRYININLLAKVSFFENTYLVLLHI